MELMNIMKESGHVVGGVAGAECITVMDPYMKESGCMIKDMVRVYFS